MIILEVKDLTKSYGKLLAVGGITFHVNKGEIVGFIGPNGSGKTTTLKMISNLIKPDLGSIIIDGYDLFKKREKALSSISGIIENPGLYQNLTGWDNLKFIQDMRKVSKDRLMECAELTGLGDHLKRIVHKYSLGMKQRLALGMCLLTKPSLLILDEPTNGLDPTGTIELREMLETMSSEENTSILFSSHLLGEVEKLADRIIYIKKGLILREQVNADTDKTDYLLEVSDTGKAMELLKGHKAIAALERQRRKDGVERLKIQVTEPIIEDIFTALHDNGIKVVDVEKRNYDLETVYNELYREAEGAL